jgi:hypothetical protein
MNLDLMVKNLSWKTVMNMNISYKTYEIINKHTNKINKNNLKLFNKFGDYDLWKKNLLINGWKSKCLNEMLIFVISDEMSMKLTKHMIEFNKQINPTIQFLGTILPKIFYLKYHLDKNADTDDVPESADSEFSIPAFIKQFNAAKEKLAKHDIIDAIMDDPDDSTQKIVDNVKWKTEQSSNDWEVLYRCISLSLQDNIGMSLSKEEYDNVNYYRLLNNPNVYGMINVDAVALFQHEMPLMRKIKYTKLSYVKNLGGEIADFISIM